MDRLKGFALLARVNVGQECNESRDFIARECGYSRDNGEIAYTAFYEELLKVKSFLSRHKIMKEAEQKPGSDVTTRIVDAIKNKKDFKYRNDQIAIVNNSIRYFYYNKLVAVIHNDNELVLFDSYRSKSTKERINRILMHFSGYKLFQKDGKWYILDGFSQEEFKNAMIIKAPDWNNPV